MKTHHVLLTALCAMIILAGGSFTCRSGDDDDNDDVRVTLDAPAAPVTRNL